MVVQLSQAAGVSTDNDWQVHGFLFMISHSRRPLKALTDGWIGCGEVDLKQNYAEKYSYGK